MIQAALVAELVLGYLSDEGFSTTCEAFEKECLVLQDRGSASTSELCHTSLKQIIADYLSVKDGVDPKDTVGNPQLLSLWKKFDGVVGQLKYATLRKGHPAKTTQSVRTKRLNQDISTTGPGRKNTSPLRVSCNPPHAWKPAQRSPKRSIQTLHTLKQASLRKGNFQQILNPALGDLSNVLLPLPPFAPNTSQQPLVSPHAAIGQIPCLIGQVPLVNASALMPTCAGAVVNPVIGLVPQLNGQGPLLRTGGSDDTTRTGRVPGQPSSEPNMPPRGPPGLDTGGSSADSLSNGNNPPTSGTSQTQNPPSVSSSPAAISNHSVSSPFVASATSGSCASSPINVEDVSPFGSQSCLDTAKKGTSQADDFVCEVVDEGDTLTAVDSGNAGNDPRSGLQDTQRTTQCTSQAELMLGSPRRKCTQPRRRGPGACSPDKSAISGAPLLPNPDTHQALEGSSLVETAVPHFLDTLLNEPLLQEKLAENINKVVASSKPESSNPDESAVAEPAESSQDGQASANDLLSLMEADPAFESLFSFFGEDALEVEPFDDASVGSHVQACDRTTADEVIAAPSGPRAPSGCTALSTGSSSKAATQSQVSPPVNRPLQTRADLNSVSQGKHHSIAQEGPFGITPGNPPGTTKRNPPGVSRVEDVTDLPPSAHVRALDFSIKDPGAPKQKTSRGRKKGSRNQRTMILEEKRTKDKKGEEMKLSSRPEQAVRMQSGAQPLVRKDSAPSHEFPKTATSMLQALARSHLDHGSTVADKPEKTTTHYGIVSRDQRGGLASGGAGSEDSNRVSLLRVLNDQPRLHRPPDAYSDLESRPLHSSHANSLTGDGGKPTARRSASIPSLQSTQTLQTARSGVDKDGVSLSSADNVHHGPRRSHSEVRETVLGNSEQSPERVSSSTPNTIRAVLRQGRDCPESGAGVVNSSAGLRGNDGRSQCVPRELPRNMDADISRNSSVLSSFPSVQDTRGMAKTSAPKDVCSYSSRRWEAETRLPRNVDPCILENLDVSSSNRSSLESAAILRNQPPKGRTESSPTSLSEDPFPGRVNNISGKSNVSSSSVDVEKDKQTSGNVEDCGSGEKGKKLPSDRMDEAPIQGQLHRGKKRQIGCDAKGKKSKKKRKKEKAINFPDGLDVEKFLSALHYEDK